MTQGFAPPPPWAQPTQPAAPWAQPAAQPPAPWAQPAAPQGAPPGAAPWAQPAAPQGPPGAAPWAQPAAPQGPPGAAPWAQPAAPQGPPGYGQPSAAPQGPPPGAAPWAQPAAQPPAPQGPWAYGPPPGAAPFGSPFAGVGESQVFTKTPFFPLGAFLVQIEELKAIESRDPAKLGHIMIVIECSILQSNVPGVVAGNRYAQVLDLMKYGKPDLKAILTALHGGRPGDPQWEQHLGQQGIYEPPAIVHFTGPTNPLRGRKLALTTVDQESRKTPGKHFTKHNWLPVQQ